MSADVERDVGERPARLWPVVLTLLLLGAALYLPRLGSSGLWDPWEPKYAQTAREMSDRGDWMVPRYRLDERLNKPPMTYWLIGASHAVGGVHEATARLPSALLALLGAVALGAALAARGLALEGLMAGGALLTSPQWLLLGRFATPDMPLAAFLGGALALVLVLPRVSVPWGRRATLLGLATLVAAAGMTDWPRGLLLPAWAVLGWAALSWSWKGPLILVAVGALYGTAQFTYSTPLNLAAALLAVLLAGLILRVRAGVPLATLLVVGLLVVALVAPWFVVAYDRAPDEMSIFNYKHAFNLGESKRLHRDSWHYVAGTVAVGAFPWTAAAALGLALALWRRESIPRILAGALIGGTLFFSLSEAKMGHFYGLLQPAAAGLAGFGIVSFVRRPDRSALALAVTLPLIWLVVWDGPARLLETATVKSNLFGVDLSFVIAAATAGWLVAAVVGLLARRTPWVVATLLPAALLSGWLGQRTVPELSPKKSLQPLWEAYLEAREPGEPLGLYGETKESAYYYSNNGAERLASSEEAVPFLAGAGTKLLILEPDAVRYLASAHPGRFLLIFGEHSTHRLVRYVPPEDEPPPGS